MAATALVDPLFFPGTASVPSFTFPLSSQPPIADGTLHPVPDPTIPRSAAGSAKGHRLQRLRATLFLVEAVADDENVQAYAAIEAAGDAFLATATAAGSTAYSEEDKNYDEDGAFTFVSPAVINTVVIFVDLWVTWRYSERLQLGLYTTVTVGKERQAGRVKDLGLTLPAKPILELLRDRDYSDPQLLPCVKALVIAEYAAQYKDAKSAGYLEAVKSWPDATWTELLGKIRWLFGDEDETACEQRATDAVRTCRFHQACHEGKEDLIVSALVDLFDRKQLAADFADRFVHASELALVFKRVESGEITRIDPTWDAWNKLPPPTDQRNVGDKLLAVCPTLSSATLSRYQRRTADGLAELEEHGQDKNVLAMRYQILRRVRGRPRRACREGRDSHGVGAERGDREAGPGGSGARVPASPRVRLLLQERALRPGRHTHSLRQLLPRARWRKAVNPESRPGREAAKRRIMFLAGEDSYFLAYTAILLLSELDCTSAARPLVDAGKIAYLADFLGSDSDLRLALTSAKLGHAARARLSLLYDRAVARRAPLERLLEAVARQRLIAVTRASGEADRAHLLESPGVAALLKDDLYQGERERIARLRRSLSHLRTMTLATLKDRLFGSHEVRTWGD